MLAPRDSSSERTLPSSAEPEMVVGQRSSAVEGRTSERYRMDGLLGWGGMGLVYRATHVLLDVPVALKVLRPELAESADRVASFFDEARWLGALSSDHIVRVVDAGWLDTGLPFLAMELLEGRDLQSVVRACGRLAPAVAVEYALQACSALCEVHRLNLAHCDAKPSNLFIASRRDAEARVKLLDFGIARRIGASSPDERQPSQDTVAGSPSYSSPEQVLDPATLDHRTDIWSLGLVLFEMLTGVCPFAGSSIRETHAKVVLEPVPDLQARRPDLEPRLVSVVQRCLQKDRERRFASMQELAQALMPLAA
jgi:serine/threonine-protein kinase